jgi:hypothetical protein
MSKEDIYRASLHGEAILEFYSSPKGSDIDSARHIVDSLNSNRDLTNLLRGEDFYVDIKFIIFLFESKDFRAFATKEYNWRFEKTQRLQFCYHGKSFGYGGVHISKDEKYLNRCKQNWIQFKLYAKNHLNVCLLNIKIEIEIKIKNVLNLRNESIRRQKERHKMLSLLLSHDELLLELRIDLENELLDRNLLVTTRPLNATDDLCQQGESVSSKSAVMMTDAETQTSTTPFYFNQIK